MNQRCSLACGLVMLGLTTDADAASAALRLHLLPQTCVITEQQPLCKIRLQVQVHGGDVPQKLCLYHGSTRHSCQQHSPASSSTFEVNIQADQNQLLQVKNISGELLASGQLNLVQYQGVHKRHKRGYLWNML